MNGLGFESGIFCKQMCLPHGGGFTTRQSCRPPCDAPQAAAKSSLRGHTVDRLTSRLAQGNMNPGIGTTALFNGIFEARARDGARFYFRSAEKGVIEILAKSTKATQEQVLNILKSQY